MKLIKQVLFPLLTAILIFLLMQPYFVWGKSLMVLNYILYLTLMCNLNIRSGKDIIIAFLFFVVFAIPPICARNNVFGILNSTLIVLMLFTRQDYVTLSYQYFVKIMSATMAVSLCVWFMLGLGVSIPGELIEPLNSIKEGGYMAYPFLVIGFDFTDGTMNMLRFSGMFDEPGVIGTITFLMLVINRYNLRKWYNIVLLIGGLVSMSLFFYVGTIIYIIVFYIFNKQISILKRVGILLFLVAASTTLMTIPITSELIVGRLEYDATTGKIKGDNRSDVYLDSYIENIRGTSSYYWGVQNKSVIERFSEHAGYRNAILLYGVVFMLLYMIMFGVYGLQYIEKDKWRCLILILIMVITLYQRPCFVNREYIFLFMCLFRINNRKNNMVI